VLVSIFFTAVRAILSRDVIDLRQTLHEFRPRWLGAPFRPRLAVSISTAVDARREAGHDGGD
jgi:hypothetical protein